MTGVWCALTVAGAVTFTVAVEVAGAGPPPVGVGWTESPVGVGRTESPVAAGRTEALAVGRNVVAEDVGVDGGDEQPETAVRPRTATAPQPAAVSNARGVRTLLRYPAGHS